MDRSIPHTIPNMEATTVARVFVNEFVAPLGAPETLHTNQGRNLESALIKEVCQLLGVTKTRTTLYRNGGEIQLHSALYAQHSNRG